MVPGMPLKLLATTLWSTSEGFRLLAALHPWTARSTPEMTHKFPPTHAVSNAAVMIH